MFDANQNSDLFGDSNALDALAQLEQNTPDTITRLRSSERLKIRTEVRIQAGNASERDSYNYKGLTGDISRGGCLILTGRPIIAGDIYWLSFSEVELTIGSLLARCMRCRVICEETFEVGFRFFDEIDLEDAVSTKSRD